MSGEIASEQLVEDFKTAQSDGFLTINDIFKERLFSDKKSICDRMQRHNRVTFANKPKMYVIWKGVPRYHARDFAASNI